MEGIVADTNDDTPTVINNLNRAGKSWGQIHRILSHEEGRNLNAVDQAIIQAIFQGGFKTLVYLKGTNQIQSDSVCTLYRWVPKVDRVIWWSPVNANQTMITLLVASIAPVNGSLLINDKHR